MLKARVQSLVCHICMCQGTVNVFNEIVPELLVEVQYKSMWPNGCICCWIGEERGESLLTHAQPNWFGSWVSTDLCTSLTHAQ